MANEIESRYDSIMDGIGAWASYFRENPNRFVIDHWGIKLKRFQEINLCEMLSAPSVFFLGCRGISKTWSTALFASVKCTLYPGTNCVVVSATRKQAGELVGKIEKDFMKYPMFALEIEDIKRSQYDTTVKFRNGSQIVVATAGESSRGLRANCLILDEARLIKKSVIDDILKKTLTTPRQAGYMESEEYADIPLEPNQIIYLTSGWYQSHWCYTLFRDYAAAMIYGKPFYAAALPYQLSIKEKLLDRNQVESDMMSSDFNEISWIMEMCAEFWSGADGAIYSYEDIAPARRIKYAFFPSKIAGLISDKRVRIPAKMHNEIRIVSADIALMQSTGKAGNNDATSVIVNQMLLSDKARSTKKIVYAENFEGLRTEEQALEIRRLIADYDADYAVVDGRGIGLPIVDALMADMYDPDTGETYCALGCINNDEIHKRCKVKNAPKKLWVVMGNPDFNSQCALGLREEFRQGNIQLLNDEEDCETDFSSLTGYSRLSVEDKYKMKAAYINTSLLIHELINLETEIKGNFVRVKEKSGMRKDRYSSLSYNIYVSKLIEKDYATDKNRKDMSDLIMQFRQPEIRKKH